jgi:predicted amidohydrolase
MHLRTKSKDLSSADQLIVALGEYDIGWHDPVQSLARARVVAQQARAAGADLLVLPEMCASGFTMEADKFAEPPDGPSSRALSALAAEHHLWLVAGLSMRRKGQYLNSALAFAPDGSLVATYDKQRLFGYAKETTVYSAGTRPCVIKLGGFSVGLFVCFDLRFPELFREVAAEVDACVIIANWPSARQRHWEVLTEARAIENQCYVVAVNRIGVGDGLEYSGGSLILDPWGTRCDTPAPGSSLRIGELSRSMVSRVRKTFPLSLTSAVSRTKSTRKKSTR